MKIRLVGTDAECRLVAGRLASIVDVQEVDGPRSRRGDSKLVSYYIECAVSPQGPVTVTVHQPGSQHERASQVAQAMTRGRRRALPPGGAR